MDFERLKAEMQEITEIVNGVPEKFQERCFEILLGHLLSQDIQSPSSQPQTISSDPNNDQRPASSSTASISSQKIPVNAALNVFLRKRKITVEQLNELIQIEKSPDGKSVVHFILEPDHSTPVATGQIYWALLLALKENIETGEDFSVNPEKVRDMCREKGFYDATNFAGTFKRNKQYFKDVPKPNGTSQPLSDEGQIALAELILKLVGQTK